MWSLRHGRQHGHQSSRSPSWPPPAGRWPLCTRRRRLCRPGGLGAGGFELAVAFGLDCSGPGAMATCPGSHNRRWVLVAGTGAAASGASLLGSAAATYRERVDSRPESRWPATGPSSSSPGGVLDERTDLPGRSTTCSPTPSGRCRCSSRRRRPARERSSNAEAIGERLRRPRPLASEGLAEARRAVRTFREDVAPLEEQLGDACARSGARLELSVPPRRSGPR